MYEHTSEFTSTPAVGCLTTGVSRGMTPNGAQFVREWSGEYRGISASEWTGEPVHMFVNGRIGETPQGCFAIPVRQFNDMNSYEQGKRDRERELAELHPDDRQRIFDAYDAAREKGSSDEAKLERANKELFAQAFASADDCDTCWYLCSDQGKIPVAKVITTLRAHIASGHRTTVEDDTDTEGR